MATCKKFLDKNSKVAFFWILFVLHWGYKFLPKIMVKKDIEYNIISAWYWCNIILGSNYQISFSKIVCNIGKHFFESLNQVSLKMKEKKCLVNFSKYWEYQTKFSVLYSCIGLFLQKMLYLKSCLNFFSFIKSNL